MVIIECQSVITMMKSFPVFLRGSGPRITIAINSCGSNEWNDCKGRLQLVRLRLRTHVAQLRTVW